MLKSYPRARRCTPARGRALARRLRPARAPAPGGQAGGARRPAAQVPAEPGAGAALSAAVAWPAWSLRSGHLPSALRSFGRGGPWRWQRPCTTPRPAPRAAGPGQPDLESPCCALPNTLSRV